MLMAAVTTHKLTIMAFSTALAVAALALSSSSMGVDAFMGPSPLSSARRIVVRHGPQTTLAPSPTRIFLEDWVAEMIDAEIWRQGHRKDFESAWMEKNRAAIVQNLNPGGSGADESMMMMAADDPKEFMQHARDVRMAHEDPQRYCADRCITTGNCDVYEDFFRMSAQQVVEFCNDCVISDGEEPCDIPEAFYDDGSDANNSNKGLQP